MESAAKHQPFWYEQADTTSFPHLMENASCDVAIVGGGITGLTAALCLSQAGQNVILVELNKIGRATTGHSTGHLDSHYDIGLKELMDRFGLSAARAVINAKQNAISDIEKWDADYRLESGFKRVPGYYYTEKESDVQIVEDEISAAGDLQLDINAGAASPLPFAFKKSMCIAQQARFSPIAYVIALSRFIFLLGGRIYEHTRMEDFHEKDGKILIETTYGKIETQNLILAGHTALTGKMSLQTRIFPRLSYVIAASVDDRVEDALYWDTNDPYFYTRIASDLRPDLLIIGGADQRLGHEQADDPFRILEDYARRRYSVRSIENFWSHEFFDSADGLPFVGRVPWSERVYVAAAYSGDGLTMGTAAGRLLSDLITGRDNPLMGVLAPDRVKPGVAASKIARFMTGIARYYVKDRITKYETNPDAVPPGEGRLVKMEDQIYAIYRDADGRLTVMSPICRHMGCIVHWNGIEQTWDCPCHGGRYDCCGNVLVGPPRKPLKRVALKVSQPAQRH